MATEMLGKKEDLHEVDWSKEQTALSDLQKEVLYTKNGDEVKEDKERAKDLTKAEYDALCDKASLSDDEVKQVVKYTNEKNKGWLHLRGLISITDKQAEELGKVKECVYLDGLTSITDKQAEKLSKVKRLSFAGLISITDKQAEELGKVQGLNLKGLTSITDKQAEKLSKVKRLGLAGLISITDKQAMAFAKAETLLYLVIKKDILTPKQKEILKKHI